MRWLLSRVAFGAEACASAYGYIASRLSGEEASVGAFAVSRNLLEIVCVFGFAFGALAVVALSWEGISRWAPISRLLTSKSRSLGEMYGEITQLRDDLTAVIDNRKRIDFFTYFSRTIEFTEALSALGIPHPPKLPNIETEEAIKDDNLREWGIFLMNLAACSRTKDIRKARRLAGSAKKMATDGG